VSEIRLTHYEDRYSNTIISYLRYNRSTKDSQPVTITLDIPKPTEGELQEAAERAGLPVSDYILQILIERLSEHRKWLEILDSGHAAAGVSLSDGQTRRESLYENA